MRNAGPSVTFSSEELTALVREALGKESGGRIAPEDLEDIEELVLVDGEVSFVWPEGSLESAERYTGPEILVEDVLKFPNLISLFVLDAEIDEENLHMLPQLQYLTLWNCGLTDVSGLENQTGLKVLYLYRNQISDLSPLAGMVNLYRLGISNNPQVTDLSPLAGMQSLEDLRASYCGYHDISVLAELPRLSEFYGYNNYIYDWSPVANIAEVYGQDTQLDMPAPFRSAAFGELVRGALGKAEGESVMMSELQGIAKMTVDAVAGTISLGWPENGVPRGGGQLGMRIYASDLRLFGNLQSLYMNGADLHGERLTDMPNLTSLALVNCGLVSCDAVTGLENLSVLALYDNAISDVSTLTGMPLLALGMDGNPLSDLSPLAEFTELELLSIEDCRCTDLSPLSGLTKLVDLYVAGNSVTDWSPVSGVANIYGQDEG